MNLPLSQQLWRRKPIVFQHKHHQGEELARNLNTFQLMMFGVGATVGTGIFFVLSEAIPKAGPAVLVSFLIAGIAAGLSALCYAEMASAIPVSGSTYSYAYHAFGELVAVVIAGCVLLEYGVATGAVARGLERLPQRVPAFDCRLGDSPRALGLADPRPGRGAHRRMGQPAGDAPGSDVHAAVDSRRARNRPG